MSDWLPLAIAGLTTGSIYGIAAMGLVLTYKTSGIFNFAHGAQAAVAAYLMYTLRGDLGLPWPVAGGLAILGAGVLGGLILERLAYGLSRVSTASRIVATVGLLIGVQGALVAIYGSASLIFPQYLPQGVVEFPGVNVFADQIITFALGVGAMVGLFLFFRRSRLGVAMQAVVDDPDLLGLQGTSALAVRRHAWVIGSVFASISGMLLAPVVGLDATLLTLLVVQAFGAAALGAFNSLVGTYLGALGIGVATSILPSQFSRDLANVFGLASFPFVVLFLALLFAPKRKLVLRGEQLVRRVATGHLLPALSRGGLLVGLAVLMVFIPQLVGVRVTLYTQALTYVILFASLGLLVRTSGQVSLCHIAFAAIGGAAFARAVDAGAPWLLALFLGGVAAVPVGAVVAIPAIRLSGVYLAIATFGFGLMVERLFFSTSLMFGGGTNSLPAPRPELFGLATGTDTGYYYVVLAIAAACLASIAIVRRSRLGTLLRALSDSPAALVAHGTNTRLTRLLVFVISAFLAGVGGALIGPVTGTTTGLSYSFFTSLQLLVVLMIAGRHPVFSPVIAATLVVLAPSWIESQTLTELLPVVFGAVAVFAAVSDGGPAFLAGSGVGRAAGRARERLERRVRRRRSSAGATA